MAVVGGGGRGNIYSNHRTFLNKFTASLSNACGDPKSPTVSGSVNILTVQLRVLLPVFSTTKSANGLSD